MRCYELIAAAAVTSFVFATSTSAQMIESPSVTLETHRAGSVEYITGGVGAQERAAMRLVGNDYNLKVATAAPSGNYLHGVELTIANASGTPILNVTTQGPLFYAKLPEGQYTIIAKVDGRMFRAPVRVGPGAGPELALSIPVTETSEPRRAAAPSSGVQMANPSRVYSSGGSRDPKATTDETQRHISLYDIDPGAADVQAQVTLYEVYPDGTVRPVTPGVPRPGAPSFGVDADSNADVIIRIEPVPEPGAALPPPPVVISPDADL